MINTNLKVFILIYLALYSVCGQEQNNFQISSCLGNCMHCKSNAPSACLDQNFSKQKQAFCLPFSRGSNCDQHSSAYENVIKQSGSFMGWNQNTTASCQLVQLNDKNQLISNQNQTYTSLGPLSSSQNLYRMVSLNSQSATNRVIIKLSLAVDDLSIQSYFQSTFPPNNLDTSSSTITKQTTTQTLINGTILVNQTKTETTTNQNQSQSQVSSQKTNERHFMYVELIDSGNTSSIIQRKLLSYNILSGVRTSCGHIYTYQLAFDLIKRFSQVGIKLYLVNPQTQQKDVSWSLLNFQVNVGCKGYVVSSNSAGSYNCDSCLSGFYPILSVVNSQVQECKLCDYRCKTCLSAILCLTCVQNTSYNAKTGMCQFSQYFNSLKNYQVKTGRVVKTQIPFSSPVIKSEGGQVQIIQPLVNNQPYMVSFDMLYSAAFRNSGQVVKVAINGQQYSLESYSLPLNVAYSISGISSSSSNLYQHRLSYNATGVSQSSNRLPSSTVHSDGSNSSSEQSTTVKIITSGQEIGVTNFNVVQFQCSKNCLECSYSQFTQTSQCKKCDYFFDLDSSCLNCANGFYMIVPNSTQQCIKCHSTCKQCLGPQIQGCTTCFNGFKLGEMIYDYTCIDCIYSSKTNNDTKTIQSCNLAPSCLRNHPLNKVLTNKNCQQCLKNNAESLTQSKTCDACWLQQNLAKSNCQPIPERGYQLYGSDISQGVISSQWTSNKNLVTKSINSFYTDLYGVDQDQTSQNQTTILTFTQNFFPNHRGLTIFLNIFKIDSWNQNAQTNQQKVSDTVNILIRSQQYIILNKTINVSGLHGNNIYGGYESGNQMVYTFVGNNQQHMYTGKTQIILTATHTGIFVRDLQVYLGNCNQCDGNKMNYELYYIPRYSTNQTQTGLDVWLTFNQGVKFVSKDRQTQDNILTSFQFSIDHLGYQNLLTFTILQNRINDWNYVKYFIPINDSLINATLRVNNTMGYNIYSKVSKVQAYSGNTLVGKNRNLISSQIHGLQLSLPSSHPGRLLLNERLSSTNVEQKVQRYQYLVLDQRKSMQQLDTFYGFFQWFTLFIMIVLAFFGIGVVFQEFSILLQLLFLHIYISNYLLPASFKQPLSHLQKMQNLNFFAYPHARDIEGSWFGDVQQKSPYPLTQYNIDIYFARSFYAIIIINLIYLFWFLVLFTCYKFISQFRNSPNKIIKFFRNIPQRPINYFDQIWRYQFITTMWASFIQFHEFDGSTAEMRLNLTLCIFAFVISLIWPVFVMVYTYRQHLVINVEHFLYLYNDIFYRKISSIADKTSYYLYIAVRFGRCFFYALFIAVFIFQNIITPSILLAATVLEIIYVVKFKTFRDKIYLTFKIIENVGFVVVEILLLIIYGFSDDTISKEGFISLGYGLGVLYILMIVNGIARFFYLGYRKIGEFFAGRYDYGEKGQLQNYDNKNPIALELPTTERGLF